MPPLGDNLSHLRYLDQDTSCRRCGYNLRGLSELGRCPECHAPVMMALLPPDLAVVDPEWIERISRGCRRVTRALFVWLLAGTVLERAVLRAALPGVPLGPVFSAVMLAVILQGLWTATEPYSAIPEGPAEWSCRRIARAGILLTPVTLVIASWIARTQGFSMALVPLGIGAPLGVAGLVANWCFARHLQKVGELIGDKLTSGRAVVYRRCYLVGWLLLSGGVLGNFLLGKAMLASVAIGGLGVTAFGFLTLGLASYLAESLPRYLAAAKVNWEQAEQRAGSGASFAAPTSTGGGSPPPPSTYSDLSS